MEKNAKLKLELLNVRGRRIGEPVDIELHHQGGPVHTPVLRGADASKAITIPDLYGPPGGIYRIYCDPPSYRPLARNIRLRSGVNELIVTCPVDPKKVAPEFPAYGRIAKDARDLLGRSDEVLDFAGNSGETLYNALDNIRRAGMLNIVAKSGRTRFDNDRTVLSYFGELRELRGDRFFVTVPQELREETKNSVANGLFEPVNSVLHREPEGFTRAGSFKTDDKYGNLQLTFFAKGSEWVADVDIDDANGVEHVFQVLRNALSGQPTHPYDIHQILMAHQELDPGYELPPKA